MLYSKNNTTELNDELFKKPTAEYRAVPFWAWNCRLEAEILKEQIGYFKEMGFGGFNMHTRAGMETEYLGKEYMELVKTCVEEAKDQDMYAWLYDEDRWPSGFAGGFVTKNPRYRQRMLVMSTADCKTVSFEEAWDTGKPYLFACYDVVLDADGKIIEYSLVSKEEKIKGTKWYAYIKSAQPTSGYNYQTYVDTLNKEAIDEFIRITHEKYYDKVGEYFGNVVPAVFTDEPQHVLIDPIGYAKGTEDAVLAWTPDFDISFCKKHGYDIKNCLPELFWERGDGGLSKVRYHYYDHVAERFAEAYIDNIGSWCDEHGINLTGHMMSEDNLKVMTYRSGDVMRYYRGLKIPGVDILMSKIEFNTLKQCQSAVHQFGREAMLSELYGVTNWDFDFRGHKFEGDWQAALGVNVRMHHLSWVSMKGEAKRDYPASVNYQSPWYKEYKYVEDHFARLNTAMTRGKPVCRVAVIHPVESYWLYCGDNEHTQAIRDVLDERHKNLTDWLLLNLIDFEFISEALLPEQYNEKNDFIGCMKYDTVIVPALKTIRSSTLEVLKKLRGNGTRIIFIGNIPDMLDAIPSDEVQVFAINCDHVEFDKTAILKTLEPDRFIDMRLQNGERTKDIIYNLRRDGEDMWLFAAHAVPGERYPNVVDVPQKTAVNIILSGEYQPVLYDTITGEIREISYEIVDGKTYIPYELYQLDSILLRLKKPEKTQVTQSSKEFNGKSVEVSSYVGIQREEPNVLLLDRAFYSLDGGKTEAEEDVLKIHHALRKSLGFLPNGAQPWVSKSSKAEHLVTLQFEIQSKINVKDALLATEYTEGANIDLNGIPVSDDSVGYFVDKSIKTFRLPEIHRGRNVLTVTMPFGDTTCIEACYILGDFHVQVMGRNAFITAKSKKYGYGDITYQGMPFYGGNLTYKTDFKLEKGGELSICLNHYRGAAMRVYLDGEDLGIIAYAPYTIIKSDVSRGKHKLEIKVLGNRVNTFGAVHNLSQSPWYGPEYWETEGCEWSYEYCNLQKTGLLSAPKIEICEK